MDLQAEIFDLESDSQVKVRLVDGKKKIRLKGFGFRILEPKVLDQALLPQFDDLKINYQQGTWRIYSNKSKETLELKGDFLKLSADHLSYYGKRLPEVVILQPRGSSIDIVSELDIEKYLIGVLPAEMPASWPLEALKAQVIASRTYALFAAQRKESQSFHLESSIFDQVFRAGAFAKFNKLIQARVLKAIHETKGKVLTHRGRLIQTFYHADCGGQTEEPYLVWPGEGFNGTVKDPSCPLSPHGQWSIKFPKELLVEKLKRKFDLNSSWVFKNMKITKRSSSGRILKLKVGFQSGLRERQFYTTAHELRRLVGFNRLKSTKFEIEFQRERVVFHGQGHGHGVGLCQWGAKSLASRGVDYKAILNHYYPTGNIALWPLQRSVANKDKKSKRSIN